jgi:hypothetical protein
MGLFADVLPFELAMYVWDLFMQEGFQVLYTVAIAIMRQLDSMQYVSSN